MTTELAALCDTRLAAHIAQLESSQRFFDAAESPQWGLEAPARSANEWALRYAYAELARRRVNA